MSNKLKTFKLEVLDSISPTFCAAKWLESDIYLHTGVTSSCHLPRPHQINLQEAEDDPLAIHNTDQKIKERQQMLQGQRPAGCNNCWNIEDSGTDVSNRVAYSYKWKDFDFSKLDLSKNIVPPKITIMVDNYCNFDCVYCDPTQSTTWATDLKTHGVYAVSSDPKKTYLRLGTKDRLTEDNSQKLTQQTVKLITDNLTQIHSITLLGGEPTINPKFWTLIDTLAQYNTSHLTLEVITNFSNVNAIKKLYASRHYYKDLRILISIDGTGPKAEFIRHGLKWNDFANSLTTFLEENVEYKISLLGTINILSLDGLIELCNWIKELNHRYNNRIQYRFFMVRWPNFQALNILPDHLKEHYKTQIQKWLEVNGQDSSFEPTVENLEQLIGILNNKELSGTELEQKDFKYFVKEYSARRKMNVKFTFSNELTRWIYEDE